MDVPTTTPPIIIRKFLALVDGAKTLCANCGRARDDDPRGGCGVCGSTEIQTPKTKRG